MTFHEQQVGVAVDLPWPSTIEWRLPTRRQVLMLERVRLGFITVSDPYTKLYVAIYREYLRRLIAETPPEYPTRFEFMDGGTLDLGLPPREPDALMLPIQMKPFMEEWIGLAGGWKRFHVPPFPMSPGNETIVE